MIMVPTIHFRATRASPSSAFQAVSQGVWEWGCSLGTEPTHPSSFKEPFPSAAKLDSKGEYTPSSLPSTPIQHNSPREAVTEVAGPRTRLPPPTLGACPRPPRYCEGHEVTWDSRGSPAAGKVESLAPPLIPKLKGGPFLNKELRGR